MQRLEGERNDAFKQKTRRLHTKDATPCNQKARRLKTNARRLETKGVFLQGKVDLVHVFKFQELSAHGRVVESFSLQEVKSHTDSTNARVECSNKTTDNHGTTTMVPYAKGLPMTEVNIDTMSENCFVVSYPAPGDVKSFCPANAYKDVYAKDRSLFKWKNGIGKDGAIQTLRHVAVGMLVNLLGGVRNLSRPGLEQLLVDFRLKFNKKSHNIDLQKLASTRLNLSMTGHTIRSDSGVVTASGAVPQSIEEQIYGIIGTPKDSKDKSGMVHQALFITCIRRHMEDDPRFSEVAEYDTDVRDAKTVFSPLSVLKMIILRRQARDKT